MTPQEGVEPDEWFGRQRDYETPMEVSRGFVEPLLVYPLFESALAHTLGESYDQTQDRVAELTSRLSAVAAGNPDAWRREQLTPAQVRGNDDGNRMVAFPYTKWMVSNPDVDMAFALIVCSAEAAASAGISRDRWIFPLGAAEADDPRPFSTMGRFDEAPIHRLVADAALLAAGVTVDDIEHLDLYSCFPSAVFLEARALGIDPLVRQVSITGGLPSGGPLASYMGHAIVRAVHLLRESPGSRAFCVGNGGYFNKLASAVYGDRPGATPFRCVDVSREAAAVPGMPSVTEAVGDAAVEATTVVFGRTGPDHVLLSALAPGPTRVLAQTGDPEAVARVLEGPCWGAHVAVDADGHATFTGSGAADPIQQ